MAKEDNYYDILGGYLRQGEPQQAEKAANWGIAIGLQAVDGLTPSDYLMDAARRNIEGEITISEVKQLLKSYYDSKTIRTPDDNEKEEADKVSSNIQELLSHRTLTFNVVGVTGTHEAIFNGVFKHAGKIREYNISKKEFVLRGESVAYMEYDWLRRALEYDLQQERDFDYTGLSKDEIIQHLCRFTAGLWEIHPFCEGNTRTTAVFLIQYLRSMGFDVNNDPFARHSWYFRNALVRANYRNPQKGIQPDKSFLVKFFRNLLLGEENELKNRYMLIGYKDNEDDTHTTTHTSTHTSSNDIQPSSDNVRRLVLAIGKEEMSVKGMMEAVGLKNRPNFLDYSLTPAINEGFVCMKYPNNPHHPRQRYLLTVKGLMLLDSAK